MMSHHLDYPADPRLDITDVYCFSGATGTVFVLNVAPLQASGFNPDGYYEFRVDTSAPLDYREDITWRVTFPDTGGVQHVQVEQLTGKAAKDRNATGKVITPHDAPVGRVITCSNGIRVFAGERGEPFYNDARYALATKSALSTGTSPNYATLGPAHNDFKNTNVSAIVLHVPKRITGAGTLAFWGNTAIKHDGVWRQVQHAAGPLVGFLYDFANGAAHVDYNASHPSGHLAGRPANPNTDPASGLWGQVRDSTAAVVAARQTYGNGPHGQATPLAYGAYVADTLLPDVLVVQVGKPACWDPWGKGIHNGKGLIESAPDAVYDLVCNEAVTMGLTSKDATGRLLNYFPYLSEPV